MKRKWKEDKGLDSKKKKRHTSTIPLVDKLSLLNLHSLLFLHGPFCLQLDKGLAVTESECTLCNRKETGEREETDIDTIIDNIEMQRKCDLYKVDALLRDVWQKSASTKVECVCKEGDMCVINFHDLDHLSWFAIQLILHNSPVEEFFVEKRRVSLTVHRCLTNREKTEEDSKILGDMLIHFQRKVYHLLYSQTLFHEYLHVDDE